MANEKSAIAEIMADGNEVPIDEGNPAKVNFDKLDVATSDPLPPIGVYVLSLAQHLLYSWLCFY